MRMYLKKHARTEVQASRLPTGQRQTPGIVTLCQTNMEPDKAALHRELASSKGLFFRSHVSLAGCNSLQSAAFSTRNTLHELLST